MVDQEREPPYVCTLVRMPFGKGRYQIEGHGFESRLCLNLSSSNPLIRKLAFRMIDYGLNVGRTMAQLERQIPGKIRVSSYGPGQGLHLKVA